MQTPEEMDMDFDEVCADLLFSIEHAYELLGRAERAIKSGDLTAGRDLMKHAAAILEDI